MIIMCKCGNSIAFTEKTDNQLIADNNYTLDVDLGREGYINLIKTDKNNLTTKFDFDSQYKYFYIECQCCHNKYKIST